MRSIISSAYKLEKDFALTNLSVYTLNHNVLPKPMKRLYYEISNATYGGLLKFIYELFELLSQMIITKKKKLFKVVSYKPLPLNPFLFHLVQCLSQNGTNNNKE